MTDTLISVVPKRRAVAVAIFSQMKLERMEVRQLSDDPLKAETTVYRLLSRLLEQHPAATAAVEAFPKTSTTRRAELARLAHELLADHGIPVMRVKTVTLFRAFRLPACRARHQLRSIIATCWPALLPRFGTGAVLDAAALGLYSQIQGYIDH
jgi:hypothetical protein